MSSQMSVTGMWQWAIDWCSRSDVAYDQSYRNMQTRPSDGKICFDCSSFTFFACWLGGGLDVGSLGYNNNLADYQAGLANAWTVTSMINTLTADGWWQYDPQTEPWQAGDILAKVRTHCEICYSPPSRTMGAHNTARGVSINDYNTALDYYDVILRYPGPGPGPTPITLPMPVWLLKRAQDLQRGVS